MPTLWASTFSFINDYGFYMISPFILKRNMVLFKQSTLLAMHYFLH